MSRVGERDIARASTAAALLHGGSLVLLTALAVLSSCGNDGESAGSASSTASTSTTVVETSTVSPTTEERSPLADYEVTFGSFGPVELGMRLDQVERAAGIQLKVDRLDGTSGCEYWFPAGQTGVEFIALDDRLARITAGSPASTVEGVSTGARQAKVAEIYGTDRVTERTNRFGIKELLVSPRRGDGEIRLRFRMSTTGDGVEFIDTGTPAGLVLDEGCAL
jgi:hypothetical protein